MYRSFGDLFRWLLYHSAPIISSHWKNLWTKINSFKLSVQIFINWHLLKSILKGISQYSCQNNYITMNSLDESFSVENFSQRRRGEYTEKTRIPFPFTLDGIWSWWQISFRFWTKWKSIWFKIERKTVTTIISHLIGKEMEI